MSRSSTLACVLVVAASVLAVGVAAASANNGNGAGTAFKTTYTQNGANLSCSGAHVVNKQKMLDDETCTVSGPGAPYYLPLGTNTYGYAFWNSDFSGPGWPFQSVPDQTVTFVYTPNGDGTYTLQVLALY